jgi:hypothetical protein
MDIAEATRVLEGNGKGISYDCYHQLTALSTTQSRLEYMEQNQLDVFSYVGTHCPYTTLLAELLLDAVFVNPERREWCCIDLLLRDAKRKGTLERCMRSPCYVTTRGIIAKPVALLMEVGDCVDRLEDFVVKDDLDWCVSYSSSGTQTNVFEQCVEYERTNCLVFLLDYLRPRAFVPRDRCSPRIHEIARRYDIVQKGCAALAWCCSRQNMGGVWDDLRQTLIERWDYRVDEWEDERKC